MKTEERKELRENSLVRWMGKVKDSIASGPSRKTVVFFTIVSLILIAYFGYRFMSNRSFNKRSERWTALYEKQVADTREQVKQLEKLIGEQSGTGSGEVAELTLARTLLSEGLSEIYVSETVDNPLESYNQAVEKIEKAAKKFVALSESLREPPILVQESLNGAAEAYESLGKFDEAMKYYGEIKKRYEKSLYAEKAVKKIEYIKTNKEALTQLIASMKPTSSTSVPPPPPDPNKDAETKKDDSKKPAPPPGPAPKKDSEKKKDEGKKPEPPPGPAPKKDTSEKDKKDKGPDLTPPPAKDKDAKKDDSKKPAPPPGPAPKKEK